MFPNGSSHGHLGYLLLAVQYIQTPADLHHTASEHRGSQGQGLSDRKQELESGHTPGQLLALPASPVLLRTCIFLHSSLHQRSLMQQSHSQALSVCTFLHLRDQLRAQQRLKLNSKVWKREEA